MKQKSNKQFMLLSALGIFFVVDMHAGTVFNIFNNVFDYESYFMQMFVFISGYFFNENNLKSPLRYLWKNTKKLIIPFFLINAAYVGFIMLAQLHNPDIVWDYRFSILDEGRDTAFTLPAWFVPMLYFVIVTYTLLRLIVRKWNSVIAFPIMAVVGAVSVYLSNTDYNTIHTVLLLKITFFIQFFELGVLYRSHIEPKFYEISKIRVLLLCVFVNVILIILTGNNLKCKYLYKMGGFLTDIPVLPLLTAVTGITFWLCITEWLAPTRQASACGKSRLVNFISNHTYSIMFHHLFFFMVFSYILSKIPVINQYFDYQQFYQNAGWYKYHAFDGVEFLYVIFGIAGSLLLAFIWDKIKTIFRHITKRKTVT